MRLSAPPVCPSLCLCVCVSPLPACLCVSQSMRSVLDLLPSIDGQEVREEEVEVMELEEEEVEVAWIAYGCVPHSAGHGRSFILCSTDHHGRLLSRAGH